MEIPIPKCKYAQKTDFVFCTVLGNHSNTSLNQFQDPPELEEAD